MEKEAQTTARHKSDLIKFENFTKTVTNKKEIQAERNLIRRPEKYEEERNHTSTKKARETDTIKGRY